MGFCFQVFGGFKGLRCSGLGFRFRGSEVAGVGEWGLGLSRSGLQDAMFAQAAPEGGRTALEHHPEAGSRKYTLITYV